MAKPKKAAPVEVPATGGETGAIGYEYQIGSTVWLALELMIHRACCTSIEIEPASHEDASAELMVPSDDATSVVEMKVKTASLEIQIKSRSTGYWTCSSFRKVLNGTGGLAKSGKKKTKGTEPRPTPLSMLRDDPERRYLFITNTGVDPALRSFVVEEIGARSKATKEPWVGEPEMTPKLSERIAIRPQMDDAKLVLLIHKLLGECDVPDQRREACRKTLIDEVRARLLRKKAKTFPVETLRGIIHEYDGLAPKESGIIRPQNFEEMQERLDRSRALLLIGPPGTGKTVVAQALARVFQRGEEAHKIIPIDEGPAQLRKFLEKNGRYLFVVEDPWGKYRLEKEARSWKMELPRLLSKIRECSGKRIIITTRTSVFTDASGGEFELEPELSRVQLSLRAENYSRLQRLEILRLSLRGSHTWQRKWLSEHEDRVLDALPEPMALNRFGQHIVQTQNRADLNVEKFIAKSAQEVLGTEFVEELKQRDPHAVEAALALWAWSRLRHGLRENEIGDLVKLLRRKLNPPLEVRSLLKWAENSGWFPLSEGRWRMHPTLLEGLDELARKKPEAADLVFGALLRALVETDRTGEALRLRWQVRRRLTDLDEELEEILGSYACERFTRGAEADAQLAYYEVLTFRKSVHPVAKLLHALRPERREEEEDSWILEPEWSPPSLDADKIIELSNSVEARAAALRFLRFVVATNQVRPHDGKKLSAFFLQLGWDFSQECLELALAELNGPTGDSCQTLVDVALSGPTPTYEIIFEAALNAYARLETGDDEQNKAVERANQWEISPATVQHWGESRSEECFRVTSALEAALTSCRERAGWSRLATYSRVMELLPFWVSVISAETRPEELAEIARLSGQDRRELFWQAAEKSGRPELAPTLLEDFSTATPAKIHGCLAALKSVLLPGDYTTILAPAVKALPWPRRAELPHFRPARRGRAAEATWWDDCFSADEITALRCCESARDHRGWPDAISAGVVDCLERLALLADSSLAARALSALSKFKKPLPEAAARLWRSPVGKERRDALLAAASMALPEADEWLRAALRKPDPEARVREAALRQLANGDYDLAPNEVLIFQNDPSALVRKIVAEIIGARRWRTGIPALLGLLRDKVDFSDYDDPEDGYCFDVARTAAEALAKMKPFEAGTVDAVLTFLAERPTKKRLLHDFNVHRVLLKALAGESDARILPLFVAGLSDTWNVGGWRDSYYPLRATAAWAIWLHLLRQPEGLAQIAPATIAAAAGDFDPSLAAPSLLVLGSLGTQAAREILAFRDAPSFTRERCLLIWSALPPKATAERDALRSAVGDQHTAWSLLELPAPPKTTEAWHAFLSQNRDCASWLRSLDVGDDVNPSLFAIITQSVSKEEIRAVIDQVLPGASLHPVHRRNRMLHRFDI